MTIQSVRASQRFDSRGKPTVQVDIETADGAFRAIVPSGASKGDYEAVELRDGGDHYQGNAVLTAVKNVNEVLGPALMDSQIDLADQKKVDDLLLKLDGSTDKSKLGANAVLGVSMAVCRAGAASKKIPLYQHIAELFQGECPKSWTMPVPFFNVLNGGVHSGNELAPQEFMIAPIGAESFEEAMELGTDTYHTIKAILKERFGLAGINVGDEGGFAPPVKQAQEAFSILAEAVKRGNYTDEIKFGMDPASSEFYDTTTGKYNLGFKCELSDDKSGEQMMHFYADLLDKYPVILLEDPFAQDDWANFMAITAHVKGTIEIVGDDLLATNKVRIKEAIEKKACTSLLLKINQIGTITESLEAARLAFENHWKVFVSHRSGETTDDFIADLTVAIGAKHLKSGAPCRGERVAKYNRLLDIEEELRISGARVTYGGKDLQETNPWKL